MTSAKTPVSSSAPWSARDALRSTDIVVAEGLAAAASCLSMLRDLRPMAEEQMRMARELKREYRDLRMEVEDALAQSFTLSPALLERYSGDTIVPLRVSPQPALGNEGPPGDQEGAERRPVSSDETR